MNHVCIALLPVWGLVGVFFGGGKELRIVVNPFKTCKMATSRAYFPTYIIPLLSQCFPSFLIRWLFERTKPSQDTTWWMRGNITPIELWTVTNMNSVHLLPLKLRNRSKQQKLMKQTIGCLGSETLSGYISLLPGPGGLERDRVQGPVVPMEPSLAPL